MKSSERRRGNDALQPTTLSNPANNRRYAALITPTATMQDPSESLFMALPLELRCLIYRRVFPTPGICTWALYQMPTAILQMNKTMREDSQFLLRRLDNQRSPKVILGPVQTGRDALYALISDVFHEAAKGRRASSGQLGQNDNGIRLVSLRLASCYNNTILSRQDLAGDATNAVASQIECSADNLQPFVRHMLKRMELKRTCEIIIRLLMRNMEDDEPSGPLEEYLMLYENNLFHNETRWALSAGSARSIEMISRSSSFRSDLMTEIDICRGTSGNLRVGRLTARDRELFNCVKSNRTAYCIRAGCC